MPEYGICRTGVHCAVRRTCAALRNADVGRAVRTCGRQACSDSVPLSTQHQATCGCFKLFPFGLLAFGDVAASNLTAGSILTVPGR
ncbi:hypothetical protein EXIGLDRAFT_440788 [Exidia glandulosa HHB12029]|uniref:Uncharacterized protein n=1 Tax=Exidia glandulosa HHB12029 TaxID=1314781 RepID=A0A165B6Z2_EXIGL|nr:hypothetical protein EXIGLDRAFT_440788 [Exidia glandulosa HHB12029]